MDYTLTEETVLNDLRMLKKSKLDFVSLHSRVSFASFLECMGDSSILLSDQNNQRLSLSGCIMTFCYNCYFGLLQLKNKQKVVVYAFGTEQGDFNLELYQEGSTLIILSDKKKYRFDFDAFLKEFKGFYQKIIKDLIHFYRGIEECKHFKQFLTI